MGKHHNYTDGYNTDEKSVEEQVPFNMGVERQHHRDKKRNRHHDHRNSSAPIEEKKTCDAKNRHRTLDEAEQLADLGNDRVALKEKPLHAYHCPKHDCYHIGHMRWIGPTQVSRLLRESRARARARKH